MSASATTSATSSVNESRSPQRASSSSRPGSWIGVCPAWSSSIFSGTTSRTITRYPSSARQAPVTRPTQPAPKIPMVERSVIACSLTREDAQALGYRNHRLVRDQVEGGVLDPVAGVAGAVWDDHVDVRAREVEVVDAAREVSRVRRMGEDRGVRPVGLLDPPVAAHVGRALQ